MTTNADLQALIDAQAQRVTAFNDSEQPWQDCPQEPIHHKGHYCEHQVQALAEHLVRNRVQVEDARHKALVAALRQLAKGDTAMRHVGEGPGFRCGCFRCIAQAALKQEEETNG